MDRPKEKTRRTNRHWLDQFPYNLLNPTSSNGREFQICAFELYNQPTESVRPFRSPCSPYTSQILLRRTTSEPGIHQLLGNPSSSEYPFISGESSNGYWSRWPKNPTTIDAEFDSRTFGRCVRVVLLPVIDPVWLGVPGLAAAVFGNPIVEFAVRSFIRVRDKVRVRGCCP